MKNQLSSVVAATAVLVLGAGAWIMVPRMQSSQRIVGEAASRGSEKARRVLDAYDASQEVIAAEAARAGLTEFPDGDRLASLVEDDSQAVQKVLEAESTRLDELVKPSRSRVQALDRRLQELEPEAQIAVRPSMRFGANASAMVGDLREGVRVGRELEQRNAQVLSSASALVAEVMATTEADASGSDNLQANRLKGMTLYQEGVAAAAKAGALRCEACRLLAGISSGASEAANLRRVTGIVQASGIEAAIAKQREAVADAESRLGELGAQSSTLATRIAELEPEIARQTALADDARAKMEQLERSGIKYEDADAVADFRREYEQLAAIYRDTSRRAQALQYGTLENARLEDGADYVKGAFVPRGSGEIEYVDGLDEYTLRLATVETQKQSAADLLASERESLARLETFKQEYAQQSSNAQGALGQQASQMEEHFTNYAEVLQEVARAEDDAIQAFAQAARAFEGARRIAQRWTTEVPAGLAGPALENSPYRLKQDDRWLIAQAQCQAADAQVEAALVLYARYTHARHALDVLDQVAAGGSLKGYDRSVYENTVSESRQAAEELLEDSRDSFESAHRDFERHWTVVASLAAADYVLSLFGHPEMAEAALRNYQNVVKDREDDPNLQPYVERLRQLRDAQ